MTHAKDSAGIIAGENSNDGADVSFAGASTHAAPSASSASSALASSTAKSASTNHATAGASATGASTAGASATGASSTTAPSADTPSTGATATTASATGATATTASATGAPSTSASTAGASGTGLSTTGGKDNGSSAAKIDKTIVRDRTFDQERALYGSVGVLAINCSFDGPADGESAFKESRDVEARECYFNLRYPFWHDTGLAIRDSRLTPLCRAALWYSRDIRISGTALHGIKALRECSGATLDGCDIVSPEFGWSSRHVTMRDCTAQSEYFMMRGWDLAFERVRLTGKYSFQYIRDATFRDCVFDTKDAFWHAKNVIVKDSLVKGEYLAWYCEDVTFDHCRIEGTQPLCYCKGLRLVDCEMPGCDLAFERSEVEATVTTPMASIKNPYSGHIRVPGVGEVIRDIEGADGIVEIAG